MVSGFGVRDLSPSVVALSALFLRFLRSGGHSMAVIGVDGLRNWCHIVVLFNWISRSFVLYLEMFSLHVDLTPGRRLVFIPECCVMMALVLLI